jgi:hypothetical protein
LRVSQGDTRFRVRAIAGTHVVLMAMDMDADTRKGLRGFAIKRGVSGQPQTFLRGIKFFEELVPNHDPEQDFSSRDQPSPDIPVVRLSRESWHQLRLHDHCALR